MKKNSAVLLVVIVVIIIGAIFLFVKTNNKKTNNTAPVKRAQTIKTPVLHDVSLTTSGFSPSTVTISVNQSVRWINKSGKNGTVNSDNYPTNKLYPILNLGSFASGSAVQASFTKTGTYTYHNQFNPQQKGTVIVK